MNGKAVFLKAAAVVSALAIGGGYVAWRSGEARKAEQRELSEKAKMEEEIGLMVGSKNPGRKLLTRDEIDAALRERNDFSNPIPGIPEGSDEVSNIVPLLPGSKSISMPVFTKEQLKALKELPPMEEEAEQELLPSSKIGILRLPAKGAEPPEKKDPKLLPGSKSIDWILDNPNREKSE